MKKLLYSAVMALVLICFNACINVTAGKEPKMDETNSTLDGKYYDNTVYKCWKFTWEYTETSSVEEDEHESGVDYEWLTELHARYEHALWMYSHNISASTYGQKASIKGTCLLEESPELDENSCYSDED